VPAWDSVVASRRPDRPGIGTLLRHGATERVLLSGTGQGSGGPALAMLPADRVLAALHGWLAPLPPEGASAIIFRDTHHAGELAAAQGIRSKDLLASGIVDVVVPEHPDAADEPIAFAKRLSRAIAHEVHELRAVPDTERMTARVQRHRRIGLV
jgi:acetyl-CoA carboxylase alpha subunit